MKGLTIFLATLVLLLQYPLWFGQGSVMDFLQLRHTVAEQRAENAHLEERNQALQAEVLDLKEGLQAIEERARTELGMIRQGETFFQVVGQ
jgi:cell division protein FtsB